MGFKKGIRQGYYEPKFPDKWVITEAFDSKGVPGIKYRSSWEKKFMLFCDYNPNILKANSEGVVIPYISPKDGKQHKYYLDFFIRVKRNNDKGYKDYIVEVKPLAETLPPKEPRNNSEKSYNNYKKAIETYAVNQAKWEYATIWAEKQGVEFIIITEKELGI